jgi:hypothetical protein
MSINKTLEYINVFDKYKRTLLDKVHEGFISKNKLLNEEKELAKLISYDNTKENKEKHVKVKKDLRKLNEEINKLKRDVKHINFIINVLS